MKNSVAAKHLYLQALIDELQPKVICLQETKLTPTKRFTLKEYEIFRLDYASTRNAKGGVAIAVHKSLRTEEIRLNSTLQAIAVKLFLPLPIIICTVYLHHEDHIICRTLEDLTTQLPSPYILTGDFNAHHALWGSQHTDQRGYEIERFLLRDQITLLNTGEPTHFSIHNGSFSAIDLTFASSSITHLLDWNVATSLYNSDHFPQSIDINVASPPQSLYPQWRIRQADWDSFINSLHMNAPVEHDNIDELNHHIVSSIIQAAENSIPQTSTNPRRKSTVVDTKLCNSSQK